MKASIGLTDLVAPDGTTGRITGFRTHRSAFLPLPGVWAKTADERQSAKATCQRRRRDTYPHLRRAGPQMNLSYFFRANHVNPRLLYHRGDDHLDRAPETVVRADRPVAELAVGGRLPSIARTIVFVILGDAGQSGIVLLVAARHLVDHEIERWDDHDSVSA